MVEAIKDKVEPSEFSEMIDYFIEKKCCEGYKYFDKKNTDEISKLKIIKETLESELNDQLKSVNNNAEKSQKKLQ